MNDGSCVDSSQETITSDKQTNKLYIIFFISFFYYKYVIDTLNSYPTKQDQSTSYL